MIINILVDNSESWLKILAGPAILLIVAWIGWKKFLFEEKIKKLTKNTEKALLFFNDFKNFILKLHVITIDRQNNDKHIDVQIKTISSIEKLIDQLFLIKENYPIPEILTKLMETLKSDLKKTCITPSNKSCDALSDIDSSNWFSDKKIDLKKIENIGKNLRNIYHNPEKHFE